MKSSQTGRLGGRKACLCKNGTYSVKCCDGSIWAQGIGRTSKHPTEDAYKYRITNCATSHTHIVHIHGSELIVGSVYYFNFENTNHNGCYTVTEAHAGEGLHINSVVAYVDCAACIAAN